MVWNARALELSVAAIQPGGTVQDWAALAHDLRWATSHYECVASLPWPLTVAKQLAQYIMPLDLLDDVKADATSPVENDNEQHITTRRLSMEFCPVVRNSLFSAI